MNRFWTFYNLGSLENIKTVLRPVLKLVWSWHPIPVVISVAINTYWLFSYSLLVRIGFFVLLEFVKSQNHPTSESSPLLFCNQCDWLFSYSLVVCVRFFVPMDFVKNQITRHPNLLLQSMPLAVYLDSPTIDRVDTFSVLF